MVGRVPTPRAGRGRVCVPQHGVVSNTSKTSVHTAKRNVWDSMGYPIHTAGCGGSKGLSIGAQRADGTRHRIAAGAVGAQCTLDADILWASQFCRSRSGIGVLTGGRRLSTPRGKAVRQKSRRFITPVLGMVGVCIVPDNRVLGVKPITKNSALLWGAEFLVLGKLPLLMFKPLDKIHTKFKCFVPTGIQNAAYIFNQVKCIFGLVYLFGRRDE